MGAKKNFWSWSKKGGMRKGGWVRNGAKRWVRSGFAPGCEKNFSGASRPHPPLKNPVYAPGCKVNHVLDSIRGIFAWLWLVTFIVLGSGVRSNNYNLCSCQYVKEIIPKSSRIYTTFTSRIKELGQLCDRFFSVKITTPWGNILYVQPIFEKKYLLTFP